MSEKTKKIKDKLEENGYFASEELSKYIALFKNAGDKSKTSIPSLFVHGDPSAGKTCLGEAFAKMIGAKEMFVQCFPRMGSENFHKDIDAETMIDKQVNGGVSAELIAKITEFNAKSNGKEGIFYEMFNVDKDKKINQEDLVDNREVVKKGILLKALEESKKGPVVITIDEIDKMRPEGDGFFLDFLQNGRLSTGTDTYVRGEYPIYCIITSNDKRDIDAALLDRSRKVFLKRPEKDLFLKILGLPEEHHLSYVYEKCPNFSIRQAKNYLEDLEFLEATIDEEALSQYINFDDLEVVSVADLERLSKIETDKLEFDLDLPRCSFTINNYNRKSWMELLKNDDKGEFSFYSDEKVPEQMHIDVNTVEQLQTVSKYLSDYYGAWFEYDEDIESNNIRWASNKRKGDGTRFGFKTIGDETFIVAMNRGSTFVYLDQEDCPLELFLEKQNEIEEKFITDSEYDDSYEHEDSDAQEL